MLPIVAASAAIVSPSPSPSPLLQIVHVVTSDRSDEALTRATRVTYVVTQQQMLRNGDRTVGDALASVPGVEIESYGAIGANQSYGIRGSSTAQVLVLVDGLPAPGSLANSVNLGTMSTSGVDRIEVVEGGGSTLFGANAVGGVINVITQRSPAASGLLRWGSFGDRELRASAGGFSFERIVAGNDYGLPAGQSGGAPAPASRDNAQYSTSTLRYGAQRRFGAIDAAFDFTLDATHGGAPGYYPFVSTTGTQDDVDRDAVLTLRERGRRSTATLQIGSTLQQIAYDCSQTLEPFSCFQPSASLSSESRAMLSLRDAIDAGAHQLLYGVDLSRGTVNVNTGGGTVPVAPSQTPPPPTSSDALAQAAVYADDVVELGRGARAYAGVRAERDGGLGGEISPSLGITTHLAPSLVLKGNYATAFRAPDATELYYPGYGNPALRPERSRVADVTLSSNGRAGSVSIGWFSNRTRDLIVPVVVFSIPSEYLYVDAPENVDRALMQGFTFEAKARAANGISAVVNATDLYAALDQTAGTRLPNDPVLTVNAGLEFAGSAHGAFAGGAISERLVGARGPVDFSQPPFFQPVAYADLRAYAAFRIAPRLQLFVRGTNLGNERYADVAGYPMPGRAFAIELQGR
jgi:vitamin B12 transporter